MPNLNQYPRSYTSKVASKPKASWHCGNCGKCGKSVRAEGRQGFAHFPHFPHLKKVLRSTPGYELTSAVPARSHRKAAMIYPLEFQNPDFKLAAGGGEKNWR